MKVQNSREKKQIGVEASNIFAFSFSFPCSFLSLFLCFFGFLFLKDRWIGGKFCTDSGGGRYLFQDKPLPGY